MRIKRAIGVAIGMAVVGAGMVTLQSMAARSLLSPLDRYVDVERSVYTQLPPDPIYIYRQIHLRGIEPWGAEKIMAPRLRAAGLGRMSTYGNSTFEFGQWEDVHGHSVEFLFGNQLGMDGTIVVEMRPAGRLASLYARLTHQRISDDPLGQGTFASFFDRSIPLD